MRAAQFATYTSPFDVTGQPAISLSLGRSAEGLPTCLRAGEFLDAGIPRVADEHVVARIHGDAVWTGEAELRCPAAGAAPGRDEGARPRESLDAVVLGIGHEQV